MLKNVQLLYHRWLLIGVFAMAPFFMPGLGAETPGNGQEVAPQGSETAAVNVRFGYGRGGYYNRPYGYRHYPRHRYRYNPYPYYYYNNYNYYPYYYDNYYYRRYPRGGGGVYFRFR